MLDVREPFRSAAKSQTEIFLQTTSNIGTGNPNETKDFDFSILEALNEHREYNNATRTICVKAFDCGRFTRRLGFKSVACLCIRFLDA